MITEETQKPIEDLVKRVMGLAPEKQEEEVTTFLMHKALELAYSLGEHKDTKNLEYTRKRQEYQEAMQRLNEIWYLPSSRSINSALVNLEKTVQ